jgi:Flp pilus assembly protein TadD
MHRPPLASHLLHLALIGLTGAVAYSNSLHAAFQFDDLNAIVGNPATANLQAFFARVPSSRPFAYLTFALSGSIGGGSVVGHHALNLAIHLLAAAGVYGLVLSLARASGVRAAPLTATPELAALFAALLFAVHPIQTQAVTYLTQRMSSLTALLYVGAVLAYVRAALSPVGRTRVALEAAALALTALALLTKENAVTLPATLALVDGLFLAGPLTSRLRRLAPFLVLTPAVAWAILGGGGGGGGPIAAVASAYLEWDPIPGRSAALTYLLVQPGVILAYLRLLLIPIGQNLDWDVAVPASVLSAPTLLSTAALGLLALAPIAWAWRARAREPLARAVILAIGWFFVTLSVESSVVPLADLAFEHRVYLPSVGLFALGGLGLDRALARLGTPGARRLFFVGFSLLVLALTAATWRRNEVWRDPSTLWSDVLAKSPGKARPYVYLAQDASRRGDHRAAVALLQKAATLPRVPPHVHLLLGISYRSLGDLASAEAALRKQVELGYGDFPGSHLALGVVLLDQGRTEEACRQFSEEARVAPGSVEALENVAACRYTRGDVAGALEAWRSIVSTRPSEARPLYNLALGYASLGDWAGARRSYEAFLERAGPDLEPQRAAARAWLAEHPR